MPWYLQPVTEQIVCTGVGCQDGQVLCPVDHYAQPLDQVDETDGASYYRCPECDFVIPDDFGENLGEGAGRIACPECDVGQRMSTFDGPCEGCNRRGVGAEDRPWPDHIADFIAAHRYRTTQWMCARCHFKAVKAMLREAEPWQRNKAEDAAHIAKVRAYHDGHRAAGRPVGTCDTCGKADYLAVVDHENGIYTCVHCAPHPPAAGMIPAQPPAVAAGWYEDPEEDGYYRWWDGTSWIGGPVLPEHAIT